MLGSQVLDRLKSRLGPASLELALRERQEGVDLRADQDDDPD